ncbi:hypothetical protein AWH62_02610 [Maricaulis sp. W15]|uniref:hypothetical protein n=1 Tax=Maricaulis sp. W15 TaxID=1772333 RepID=UPI000948B75A|nr:hypothetical protein [Maricaulis sp. W15]OLF81579.1 hypothetical protein AWH62_02610 [Maricaulis sp. W15]
MRRALIKTSLVSALALAGSGAAMAEAAICADAPILLRDVTIIDASGEWDDQDILIEAGRISAIGSEIELETGQAIIELGRPGAIVRPGVQPTASAGAIFIRTSTAASRRTAAVLSAGSPADLLVYATDEHLAGQVELEIRGGRIAGLTDSCVAG